jgi:hypothetical protein
MYGSSALYLPSNHGTYVCMYVCAHACMVAALYTSLATMVRMCVCMYVCAHACMVAAVLTLSLLHQQLCNVHTYIYTYIQMRVDRPFIFTVVSSAADPSKESESLLIHTYIHTYIHTHIHTHTDAREPALHLHGFLISCTSLKRVSLAAHIYIHIHTYIHTHTHTYRCAWTGPSSLLSSHQLQIHQKNLTHCFSWPKSCHLSCLLMLKSVHVCT